MVTLGGRGPEVGIAIIWALAALLAFPGATVTSADPHVPPADQNGSRPRLAEPAQPLESAAVKSPGPARLPLAAGPAVRLGHQIPVLSPISGATAGVNPLVYHSHEPAPTGIADFGVEGIATTSYPYTYSTNSLEGAADVRSMSTSIATTAFELNAVLVLQSSGVNYSYWIQNGLHVAPATLQFTIGGAYVWNFSSAGAHLAASELQGATGSVLVSDTYYYIPGCNGLPGQCSTLSWPSTLTGRISAGQTAGVPNVAYQYNLGAGWVTYDTVSFPQMTGAQVVGFSVNGFKPTPYANSLFYDAEWVWVGAGGGTTMVVHNSSLNLSLTFWNGNNYQAVPNAWNFGGNTGEMASNVTESLSGTAPRDLPSAHIVNGAGSLGVLYNRSERGFLDVTSPTIPNGTLLVSGSPLRFTGNAANLTLGAGTYSVSLQNYSNASWSVTIIPGQTSRLNLSGAGWTAFRESGLPVGTPWGLTINGVAKTSTSSSLSFTLANGSYTIAYATIPGFVRNQTDPSHVTIPTSSPITLRWAPFTYAVPLTESGLPAGTAWWANANGRLVRGAGTTLYLPVPNGSTPFTAGSVYEFVATPSSGTLTVTAGQFGVIEILFSYRPSFLAGTVSPANAAVTLNGTPVTVSAGSFNDTVIPGTYALVASATGYSTRTLNVTVTAGNVTAEQIVLAKLPSQSPGGGTGTNGFSGPPTVVLVGLGAAIAAAGAILGAAILARRRTVRGRPPR
ncbi:MAG: thermopsin family protease [Thermoplasmata archaeon]|nr:thermopsin family protease [Thermoplasmata archaeon]